MARLARVVVPECPHHVTQRGNGRRFILQSDAGRQVYWQLLQRERTSRHINPNSGRMASLMRSWVWEMILVISVAVVQVFAI
jgi:hypothetical protein